MKKIFICLFLLLGVAQTTWAQYEECITELMLIGGNKSQVNSMIDSYTAEEGLVADHYYSAIKYDLNKGARGDYVYLLFKYPPYNWEPITDVYLRVCDSKPNPIPQELTHNGHTYHLVKLGGNNDFNNQGGDLNYGVGGKYIYLYYTKEELIPARKIHKIYFDGNSTLSVGKNGTSTPCDLNEGAGGNYIYMHLDRYTTEAITDVSTEEQLKEVVTFNNANIRLTADINLSEEVVIQNGKNITIDLNGKTLNRGLSSPATNGHVLTVLSGCTLTVNDSSGDNSGSIRGGYANTGGAINNLGTFIFNGGTIEASKSTYLGAGIWNQNGAKATINGGVIQNCKTTGTNDKGGGIYNQGTLTVKGGTIQNNSSSGNGGGIYNDGELRMQGNPIVSNNTKGNAANNVYLPDGKVINVTDAFTTGAHIGITPASYTAVLTSFYSNYNSSTDPNDYFFIDDGNRLPVISSGEVYEGLVWTSGATTCTLNVNGVFNVYGTGAMADITDNIPWGAFQSFIQSVVVEDGVTQIGSQCFYKATNLTDISIGRDLTTIGKEAFYGCENLNTFTIPANVTTIGEGAFYHCGTEVYCYANPNYLTVADGLQGSFKDGKATRFHVLNTFLEDYKTKFPNANVTWLGDLLLLDNWTDEGNFATSFSNQSGNTITIMNEAEFARLAYMVNQQHESYATYTFKLNRDLLMSQHNWLPIGDKFNEIYFEGIFDGQGHTISGVLVDRSESNYNGLFGLVGDEYRSTIKNLRMTFSSIKGKQYTGAIVGYLNNGRVENCVIDTSVSVEGGNYTGGILGAGNGYNNGVVYFAVIENSLFKGSVSSPGPNKGAICGSNTEFKSIGSFYTDSSLRGFSIDAKKNVFAMPITADSEGIHLVLSENSYIINDDVTYVASDGSAKLTVVSDEPSEIITEVKINGTLVGTSGGPHTLDMIADATNCVVTATKERFLKGSGTEDDPYVIGNLSDWDFFATMVNNGTTFTDKYVVLADDIEDITTMAGVSETMSFQGIFDGQNHKLTANINSSVSCASLFPYLKDAIIKRVHVDGNFFVGQYGAALAGKTFGTNLIEDVKVTARVIVHSNVDFDNYHHGGVVGNATSSSLTMCGVVFSGQLYGGKESEGYLGGRGSYAYAGGLIGWSEENATLTLKDCLFCGTYIGEMSFHPIAIRDNYKTITATATNVLYTTSPRHTDDTNNRNIAVHGEKATESTNSLGVMIITDGYNMLTAYQTGIFYAGKYYLQPLIQLANNADNCQTLNDNNNQVCNVVLADRVLYFNRDWNTLCLPFDMTAQQLAASPLADATLMEFDGSTSAYDETSCTLTLSFSDATTVKAGKPYLLKWKNGLTITNGTAGINENEGRGSLRYLTDGIIDPGDGSSKKWCARNNNQTWFAEFCTATPVNVTSYTMTTGNDTYDYQNRNPKVWTLKAKLNASDEWTTIDSRNANNTPADAMPTTNFTAKSYDLATSGNYQYFRLDITQNGGGEGSNGYVIQLSEFSINGTINNPMFAGVTIDNSDPSAVNSSDDKASFTGTYVPMSFDTDNKSILFLGDSNTLFYPESGASIGAFCAYFQLNDFTVDAPADQSQGVHAFVLNFGGETNAIENIPSSILNLPSEDWYTIDGRKLYSKPTKPGLYIYGRKKVVIK